MEELKGKFKEYVWKHGLSPYKEGGGGDDDDEERGNGLEVNNTTALCAFNGCTLKAMALTKFCHLHILSDSKQVLYKPCEYVIKRLVSILTPFHFLRSFIGSFALECCTRKWNR